MVQKVISWTMGNIHILTKYYLISFLWIKVYRVRIMYIVIMGVNILLMVSLE